jgi:hypothetical protein
METFLAGICAVPSFIFLINDYKKRYQFNNLVSKKSVGDFKLIEGVVKSDTPLPADGTKINTEGNNNIAKQTKSYTKSYHTYYSTQPIYSDNKTTIYIPVSNTYEIWNKDNVATQFSNNIFIKNTLGNEQLFLNNDTKIAWDKKNKHIINNTKTNEKVLYNAQFRTVFGKDSNGLINVKYIGNEAFVNDKIRSDHYGINNWTTGLVGFIFTLSTSYLISSIQKNDRK